MPVSSFHQANIAFVLSAKYALQHSYIHVVLALSVHLALEPYKRLIVFVVITCHFSKAETASWCFASSVALLPESEDVYARRFRLVILSDHHTAWTVMCHMCGIWDLVLLPIGAGHSDLNILCVLYVSSKCARQSCSMAMWLCLCYHVACPYCPFSVSPYPINSASTQL